MKNMNIRKKFIPIYVVISIFTFILFFTAFFIMRGTIDDVQDQQLVNTFAYIFPVYLVVYFVCIFLIGRTITKQVAFPAQNLVQAVEKLAVGDVDVTLTHHSADEMGVLTDNFRRMVDSMREQAMQLEVIATGDYTADVRMRSENDVMNKAIIAILDNNNRLVSEIRSAAQQVALGAQQIAQSAQTLSDGSTQQASAVEEFSATLAGVMQQSAGNADAAQQALEVTSEAGRKMEEGMQSMRQVSGAMDAIAQSSEQITNVIKVIQDIATQTNLLALNAAVEAARAGEHGKGFAVVADEVRNLAAKSGEAAKETTALIDGSVQRVGEGNQVVANTGAALTAMGELSAQTQELVTGISSDSTDQSQSIAELNASIEQISNVVQSTSATAEESAAAAEEMSAQSQMLTRTVARFKLKEDRGMQARGTALPPARH